jgi:eukaryotic-like serine/threonine-protein kinase
MKFDQAKSLLDLAAMKETGRDQNRREAVALLKEMESVIPRAEAWLLGDHYDEAVVAPEFDLAAWEQEHGLITPTPEFAL